jgi:hypothetical protein
MTLSKRKKAVPSEMNGNKIQVVGTRSVTSWSGPSTAGSESNRTSQATAAALPSTGGKAKGKDKDKGSRVQRQTFSCAECKR